MNDFDKSKEELIHELDELRLKFKNSQALCHKQQQELNNLHHKDNRFIEFSNLLPEIIFETDAEGKLLLINKQAMELTGYTREDFNKGIYAIEMLAEQDRERAGSHMRNILKGEEQPQAEFIAQRKDKSTFPILVHSIPILKKGEVVGMRGVIYDLSEDKKREHKNKYLNEERQIIINKSGIEIAVIDFSGKIHFLNDYSARSFKVSAEKIIGRQISELFPAEVASTYLANIRRVIKTGEEFIHETLLPVGGNWRWYYANLQPFLGSDGKINKVMVIAQNITEKKHAEEKLNEHRTMAKILMDAANEFIFLLDKDFQILTANPAAAKRLNENVEDLIGKSIADIPPHTSNKLLCENRLKNLNYVLKTEKPIHFSDSVDGFYFDVSIYPIFKNGKIHRLAVYCRDITERKHFEEALSKSEEQYRLVFENSTEAILVIQDRRLKFFNPRAEEVTGYTYQELNNLSILKIIHPEDKASVVNLGRKQWTTSRASKIHNIRIVSKDGKIRWVEIGIVKIQWQGRPALLNFATDITQQKEMRAERIQLYQQLIQTQKMELIGRLASGIAHDFNNLLSPIIGNLSLTSMEITSQNPLHSKIAHILELSRQAQHLTRQLLTFGRKQEMILLPVNLNKEITQFNKILRHLINKNIDLKTNLAPSPGLIKADSSQIHQILMNLVINAQDAMPDGGQLMIETENVTLEKEMTLALSGAAPGKYVVLSVSDTGHGMEKETLKKIFEPFYTTKNPWKGTGLGLSTIQHIMNQYKGFINVFSELNKGTTFKLYFPQNYEELSTDAEKAPPNFNLSNSINGYTPPVDN